MSYQVVLLMRGPPRKAVLEAVLEAVAVANCAWYLDEWSIKRDPPRSARDAGVRWQPDRPDVMAVFEDAPTVFGQGAASCGPIAAISVGYARARDRVAGATTEATRARHRVELRPDPRGASSWHAYHWQAGRLLDPTEGMRR